MCPFLSLSALCKIHPICCAHFHWVAAHMQPCFCHESFLPWVGLFLVPATANMLLLQVDGHELGGKLQEMVRHSGAWWAAEHGVTKVGHALVTEQQRHVPFIAVTKHRLYSLCCTKCPCSLLTLYMRVCASDSPTPVLPLPLSLSPPETARLFSVSVSLVLFAIFTSLLYFSGSTCK